VLSWNGMLFINLSFVHVLFFVCKSLPLTASLRFTSLLYLISHVEVTEHLRYRERNTELLEQQDAYF